MNRREPGGAASESDDTNSTGQTPAPSLDPAATLTGNDSVTTNAVAIPVNDAASTSRPVTAGPSLPSRDSTTTSEETTDAAAESSASAEVVQAARILNQAGQSHLHLGLRTQAFGSVQLHTQIRDSAVELLVGSQKGELHSFLTAESLKSELSARDGDLRLHDMRFLAQEQNNTIPEGVEASRSGAIPLMKTETETRMEAKGIDPKLGKGCAKRRRSGDESAFEFDMEPGKDSEHRQKPI